jgi:arabinofuranosyltransferase
MQPWPSQKILLFAGLLLLLIVLIRTAWIADDAYTTFRVADNFLHGEGLRWNTVERVQVYTHPLWLLLLIPVMALLDPYYGSMLLGASLTLVFAFLVCRVSPRLEHTALVFTAMLSSMACIDYSTSGLENPLVALLVMLSYLKLGEEKPLQTVFLASLVMVNRLDHTVLVLPAVLVALKNSYKAALGLWPIGLWELFSIFYYGSPFPNTAYAKLGAGIPAIDLATQGFHYLQNSGRWDPVTLMVMGLGAAGACMCAKPGDRAAAVALGLWVLYVIRIGGDHMAGRFLSTAFALGLFLLVRAAPSRLLTIAGILLLVGLGAQARTPPLSSGTELVKLKLDKYKISDERAFLYRISGLLRRAYDMKLLWSFISKTSIEYAPLVKLSGFQAGKGRQPSRLESRKVHERSI